MSLPKKNAVFWYKGVNSPQEYNETGTINAMASHVSINRDYWNGMARDWVASGEVLWAEEQPVWGIWDNSEVQLLPETMTGLDAIELGCGTGYVSAWMARRGARVTGVGISVEQLATARRLMRTHGLDISFLEANAEDTGLPGGTFDFAISEYGAAIWCDPQVWLREAWRLLRPGGRCVFLGNHPLMIVTTPPDGSPCETVLHRPYRALGRTDWTDVAFDPGGIEFNLSIGGWIALFAEIGFEITGYEELYARPEAIGTHFSVPADWAKMYPSEQVWRLRKPDKKKVRGPEHLMV